MVGAEAQPDDGDTQTSLLIADAFAARGDAVQSFTASTIGLAGQSALRARVHRQRKHLCGEASRDG